MSANFNQIVESNAQIARAILRLEDEGWSKLKDYADKGSDFTLTELHDLTEHARKHTKTSVLLKRGLQLGTANVFGRGVVFEGDVSAAVKSIAEKPVNETVLFTDSAFERNTKSLYNSGNLFVTYNSRTKEFARIPMTEITNDVRDPRNNEIIRYYEHTYTYVDNLDNKSPVAKTVVEWIRADNYEPPVAGPRQKPRTHIQDNPVLADTVMIHVAVGVEEASAYGTPDCLQALPWALAHAEYLKDGSKVLKALATIAWSVTGKNASSVKQITTQFAKAKGAGATAAGVDYELKAMPRGGSVNLKDGQELASYVAAGLGVSLVALLADPGAASGSFGAAASLDGPSADIARARQGVWAEFYRRCYRAMGATGKKQVIVNFPKLLEDPIHRQLQSLALARETGAIYQDEYRPAVLEALSLVNAHIGKDGELPDDVLPTFSVAKARDAQDAAERTAAASATKQGQDSSVGKLSDGDNSNRDQDTKPGTGS